MYHRNLSTEVQGRPGLWHPSAISRPTGDGTSTTDCMGEAQENLFKYVPGEDITGLEKSVAFYLESQQQLLWWYRNMSRTGYRIQGWRPHRVYPDFIAASKSAENSGYDKVFVLETKGDQLSGNPDTEYKRKLLALCNEQAVERSLDELYSEELGRSFVFEMIDESSWENQLNKLLKI